MKARKTRKAYGKHENGNVYYLGDTVQSALNAHMTVRDYEKALITANPQLKIEIRVEEE